MRTAFIQELILQARQQDNLFLIVGDLGYSVVEPFALEFPDRFLNAGVAEQNMTGVAAGLASEGYHVFTYSIGNFPTLRCLEQIRNDVCYHKLPVTIVAVGAGTAYGNLGYSHHCVQDIACLRGFPGISILSPGDPREAQYCVRHLCAHPGPSYLRIGKAGEKPLHNQPITFDRPVLVSDKNARTAIIATGSVLTEAVAAGDLLARAGDPCDILSLVHVTATAADWIPLLERYESILVVEEHVRSGGIGEMIACEVKRPTRIKLISLSDDVLQAVGTQTYLRGLAGMNAASLAAALQGLH